jgi:hypothetical protein
LKILFEEQALAQVRAIHKWWTENRRAAPDLLARELASVVARLRADEVPGTLYPSRSVADVRRILCALGPATTSTTSSMPNSPRQ